MDDEIEVMSESPGSVRRTLTMRSNAARQVAVNFMPSRQLGHGYSTLRHRRTHSEHNVLLEENDTPDSGNVQADIIVREMEQHQRLMEDNPESEELRREALRDLPQGLTTKRNVRAKLSTSVSLRSRRRPISVLKRLKYRMSFAWKRARDRMRNVIFSLELWYEAIRNIEGHFGSAVGSYFYFLRRLFAVNLLLSVMVVGFVVVPQVLSDGAAAAGRWGLLEFISGKARDRMRNVIFSLELWYEAIRNIEGHFGSAVGSYFYFLRRLFAVNLLLSVMVVGFVVVPQVLSDGAAAAGRWGLLEFISGKGAYEDSLLFYGHYHSSTIDNGVLSYNMAFAYFFTMASLYLVIFGVLCYTTAYSYRRNFIETSGGVRHVFSNKVFCGWDFGIVSKQAATLTAASIYSELKELLNEQNKKQVKATFCIKLGQYLANITVSALVIGFILGLEFGLWQLLSKERVTSRGDILVSMLVTVVIAVCPLLMNLVARLEFYRARTRFYVTLARTWLLDVGTLMLIFVYWTRSGKQCWETSFGQEAYRLVLLDAAISLVVLPAIEFIRAFIYKRYPSEFAPEFNIAYNSLTIIYNQAVLWFGMLFSPLLTVIVTIKFLLLFYVKRECALRACQPARKVWRAAQTETVLYMLVTLSLFATLFAVGTLFLRSSSSCGPFKHYSQVYQLVSEGVLNLSNHAAAAAFILFLTRPGLIGFLMLFLCVSVYYMRAKARAHHSMIEILRHMLVLQAKDKDFLLSAINKVSKGEWMYSPKPDLDGNSHTMKYLKEVRRPSNVEFHFDASKLSNFAERPRSYAKENRSNSYYKEKSKSNEDGDTDSSFSWQENGNALNDIVDVEEGDKKWI